VIGICFLPHFVNSYTSHFWAGVRLKGVVVSRKEKRKGSEKGKNT